MVRILVTGGAGFLGSNLCRALVENPDNHVIALDNLYTGRMENIQELLPRDNFTFLQQDVCDPVDLRAQGSGLSCAVSVQLLALRHAGQSRRSGLSSVHGRRRVLLLSGNSAHDSLADLLQLH